MKRFLSTLLVTNTWGLAATPPIVLINDFRKSIDAVELSAKEQARVIARIRRDLKLPSCEGGEVRQQLKGRFTRNLPQTAYLMYNCQTYAAQPLRKEYGRLVIYQGGELVANFKNIGDEVKLLPDLDGDGVNELLFVAAYGPHLGELSENASIVSVKEGKLRTLLDVDNMLYDTCSGMSKDASTVAWRVRVEKSAQPIFTLDRYEAKCSLNGQSGSDFIYQFSKRVLADTP